MSEACAWPEGAIYLWTGTATASGVVAYAERVYGTLAYGINTVRTFDGVYHNLWTGQRADVYVAAFYTTDALTFQKMAAAQTGVHAHLKHTAVGASAGVFLYSGALNSVTLNGANGDVLRYSLALQANNWSAY
jgi:hypothetical protein